MDYENLNIFDYPRSVQRVLSHQYLDLLDFLDINHSSAYYDLKIEGISYLMEKYQEEIEDYFEEQDLYGTLLADIEECKEQDIIQSINS